MIDRAVCVVRSLDIETHDLGLEMAERYGFSIYDGLIVAAAVRAGYAILYTEDLQPGQGAATALARHHAAVIDRA